MIKFSAPAKIHLLGEHSVVYGKPAILAAINLRAIITLEPAHQTSKRTLKCTIEHLNGVMRKVVESIVCKRFKLKNIPPYSIKIDSQIPIGSGLGSSAAVSAAYIASLLSFLKINWDLKLVNELAYEAEKIFHGNPSGGDNTTVVFGGLIWYRKELDFLKTFSPLPFKVHRNIKPFYLIDSGKPVETTREMVEKVRVKWLESGVKIEKIFNDQERLVKELAVALKDGNEEKLIEIIRNGERNLEKMGVVGKKAKEIIRQVEKSGGAAKILGGGGFKEGSGIILCYNKTLMGQKITLGEEGLRKE